jgi:S-(hydroxymethyl)glutathione dehydrogenase / alcohol dehydrogenase
VTGRPYLCRSTKIKRAPGGTPRLRSGGVELYQNGQLGGFAETMLVHEHALVRIDPEMPLDRAALLACGTMTGVGAVFNTAKVAAGATVAVIGCGAVGLNLLQGPAIAGASRVIVVDLLASKHEGGQVLVITAGEGVVAKHGEDPIQVATGWRRPRTADAPCRLTSYNARPCPGLMGRSPETSTTTDTSR